MRFLSNKKTIVRLAVAAAMMSFFAISRVAYTTRLPLFADEAYAILRAREIHHGAPLLSMLKFTTQPIFIWLIALFQSLSVSMVISARMVSAFAGFVTALALAAVSSRIIGKQSFWIAFIITTILPFSVFYDRTALFESATTMWMALSLIAPVIATPLGILTKQTAWFVLPLVLVLNIGKKRMVLLTLLSAIAIPFIIWFMAFGHWTALQSVVFSKTSAPLSFTANFKANISRTKLWLSSYLTLPVMLVSGIGGFVELKECLRRRRFTPIAIVGGWCLSIVLFESATARIFYPRYLHPLIIGIVLLTTKYFSVLNHRWNSPLLTSIAFGLVFYLPIQSDIKIILQPHEAPIALEDKFQFYDDLTSGTGARELAGEVVSIVKQKGFPVSVYLEEENSYLITLFDTKDLAEVDIKIPDWLIEPLYPAIPDSILHKAGEQLFIRNRNPDIPDEWPVQLIRSINKTASRKVFLYRILK